jgi:geranylgeranyl reductase
MRLISYYADVEKQESESCQFWFGDDVSPRHYAWVFPHHREINIGLIADDRQRMGQFFRRLFERASLQGEPPKPKGYFIPYWKPMTLYRDRVFYVGDSASLVLPFTYEGIYYALQSGRLAARAILENDPDSYAKNWNELNLKKFKFLRLLQTIFLRNDWFARRMSRLYRHPKFQRAVIGYWSGSRKPAGFFMTFWKIIKALTVYRD